MSTAKNFFISIIVVALNSCVSTPNVASPPKSEQEGWRTVQFDEYNGPFQPNKLNAAWAEAVIANHKTHDRVITFDEPTVITKIHRETANGCWLPESQSMAFTAGPKTDPEHWKEGFLWSGHVSLIKDTQTQKGGKVTVNYYLTRGKHAVQGRPIRPEERSQ